MSTVNAPTVIDRGGFTTDVFTATGTGTTVSVQAVAVKSYSIAVKGTTAAATSWTAILEISLDGTNFTTLLTHSTGTGDGVVLANTTTFSPSLFFRARLTALVLGPATDVHITVLGLQ